MAKKYLDSDGLLYFWQKIKAAFVTDVTYNSTSKKIQKTKAGATSDVVTLSTVATSGSYNDLSNKPTIPSGVEKSTTTPKMDGTASVGSETKFAAGDHVHPTDTSRVPTIRKVNGHALSADVTVTASDIGVEDGAEVNQNAFSNVKVGTTTVAADTKTDTLELIAGSNVTITPDATNDKITIEATDTKYTAASATPLMDGTAVVGSSAKYAREDHVHPSDTTKVDKVDGKGLSTNDYTDDEKSKLAGIAAGAEVNVNADWNATSGDAQILNKPTIPSAGTGTSYPAMDGTRSLGSNAGYARVDHVHPSDTSRVPTTRKINGLDLTTDRYIIREMGTVSTGGHSLSVYIDGDDSAHTHTVYDKEAVTGMFTYANTTFAQTFVPKTTTVNGNALSGNITLDADDVSAIPTSAKGAASGVCPLNASSKIDTTYLPSYVDDVIEAYARSGQTALSSTWLATGSATGTVITPEAGKIYILMADSGDYSANSQFRWSGTTYVKMADGGVSSITNSEIDTIVAA